MAAIIFSLALMFGAIIATRYRVAALILALPIAVGIVGCLAIRLDAAIPTTLAWQVLGLVGLQLGYLAGGFLAAWNQRPSTRA